MEEKTVRSRRLLTMTRDQDRLLKREAHRRNAPEYVVLREVLDAGFEARFGGNAASVGELSDALTRLAEDIEQSRLETRAQGLASLGWASWASFAAFEMQRRALRALGVDPDGKELASGAMSGFMSSTDCNVPTRIWESAGRRMARGDSYHDALVAACRENGVAWEAFSGAGRQQPGGEEGSGREGGKRDAKRGKRRNR